jgi:transposase
MPTTTCQTAIAVVGIDIGTNSFRILALDDRGAIVLRQKWSRCQVETRFANMPPCLIGMEACVRAHPKSEIQSFRPRCQGGATSMMKFVAIKTVEQLDLQGLHRVRERSLATFTSRTILPVSSTTQTLVSLTETSSPAK